MGTVVLPNGEKVHGVPEGVSLEEVMRRLSLAGATMQEEGGATPTPDDPAVIPRPRGKISAASIERRQELPFPGQPITEESEALKSAPVQFAKEAAKTSLLPTLGTAAGVGIGALTGPLAPGAIPTLGMVGGAAGEKLNQILGITPEDSQAVGLAAIAPMAGPMGAHLGRKMIGRPVGWTVGKIPFVKTVQANMEMRKALPELESLPGMILSKQRGKKAVPAKRLYKAAERAGAFVPTHLLKNTEASLGRLADELEQLIDLPEYAAAFNHVKRVQNSLAAGGEPVALSHLVAMRKSIGSVVNRLEASGDTELGTAKVLFSSLANDLDMIARSKTDMGKAAKFFQAAIERSKIEFAISKLETQISKSMKYMQGEDSLEIDITSVRNFLREAKDPKHPNYDKNFASALEKEIPVMESRLRELDRVASKYRNSPAGPGSLVVRGIGAASGRSLMSGLFGFGFAASGAPPLLTGAGALIGASMPEIMVSAISNPRVQNVMNRVLSMGKGPTNVKEWAIISQAALQIATAADKTRETVSSIKGTPKERAEQRAQP